MGGGTNININGDKIIVRMYPYVVNKAFACEVYLKLLLLVDNEDFDCRKEGQKLMIVNEVDFWDIIEDM